MGSAPSLAHRHLVELLILAGVLALCAGILFGQTAYPRSVVAQISPLSPLAVATPLPAGQPQVLLTDTPSPLQPPQAESSQSSFTAQSSSADPNPSQSLIPLGSPAEAEPSLILVGALLVGLAALVIVVLVARRRE